MQDAVLDLADRGLIELVDAASGDEVAAALEVAGSVLVSYEWRPDFRTDGLTCIQGLGVGIDQFRWTSWPGARSRCATRAG